MTGSEGQERENFLIRLSRDVIKGISIISEPSVALLAALGTLALALRHGRRRLSRVVK